jgi:hypothetical protein
MKIRLRILAMEAGSFPDLAVTYRRLPKPAALGDHQALVTSDTALTLDMSAAQTPTTMAAEEYIEVETSSFAVAPGDAVLYTVARSGQGGDGYAAEMHVIDQRPVIVAIS